MFNFSRSTALVLTIMAFATTLFCSSGAGAQDAGDALLGPADLQQMTAPVALYPDALLAQILVACTYPDDVAAAVQYLDGGGDPNGVDTQGWDLSVAGVARYPDLLHYLVANGAWMNSLGEAFLNQQADVMNAVQALRGEALAAGNLVSNDQQQVVTDDDGTIEIVPTDPQLIYPPIYDSTLVYEQPVVVVGQPYVPLIHYWRGISVGAWLHHDLDWHDHTVYVGSWGADRPWWRHDAPSGRRFDYTQDRPGLFVQNNTNITVNVHNQVTNVRGGAWSRADHDPKKPMPRVQPTPAGRAPARPAAGFPRRDQTPAPTGGAIDNYNPANTVAQQVQRGRASIDQKTPRPDNLRPTPQVNRHALPTASTPAAVAPPREAPRAAEAAPARPARAAPEPARPAPEAPRAAPEPGRSAPEPGRSAPEPGRSAPEPARSAPEPARSAPQAPRAQTPARSAAPPTVRSEPAPIRGGAVSTYGNGSAASSASARGSASRGGKR